MNTTANTMTLTYAAYLTYKDAEHIPLGNKYVPPIDDMTDVYCGNLYNENLCLNIHGEDVELRFENLLDVYIGG